MLLYLCSNIRNTSADFTKSNDSHTYSQFHSKTDVKNKKSVQYYFAINLSYAFVPDNLELLGFFPVVVPWQLNVCAVQVGNKK